MDEAFMVIIKFYYNFLQYPILDSFEKQKINKSDIEIMKNIRTIDNFMNFMIDIIKENGIKKNSNLRNIKIEYKNFNMLDVEHYFLYKVIEKINKKHSDELLKSLIIIVYDENNIPTFSTYIPYKNISLKVMESYIKKRG